MTLSKHEATMRYTRHSTRGGVVHFHIEGGLESIRVPAEIWEEMGSPGVIHVTVEPGPIPEPEEVGSEDRRPLQILRDALGDDTVDHYLNVLGLLNRDQEAKALLSAVDTIKKTGGAVEIAGVRIEPCDTYGHTDTTREVEALRRQVQGMVQSRVFGPIVVSRDEMPYIDARGIEKLEVDTHNIDFVFLLESGPGANDFADQPVSLDTLYDELTAEDKAGPNPFTEVVGEAAFDDTTAAALRNLAEIAGGENVDIEYRLRAAKLILDHLQ